MSKFYKTKYTLGSYADLFMSAPIIAAKGVSKTANFLCDKVNCETPEFFDWEKTTQNSPTYKARQSLRDKLDTEPGMKFLYSNILATPPFLLVGLPAAELAQLGIDKYLPDIPELAKFATNSVITLLAQMASSYVIFMVSEVRNNRDKYTGETGKLSGKKIKEGVIKALKTFLTFDLTYIGLKTAGQSYCLYAGKDPWKASAITDTFLAPGFWSIAISLGLSKGLIQARKPEEK